MCFDCGREWHLGMTCDEAESKVLQNDPNYKLYLDYLKENCKTCPNCDTPFVKGGACFHMTCKHLWIQLETVAYHSQARVGISSVTLAS